MLFDKILSPFNVSKVTHFYTSNINDISIVAYNDLVYNIEVEDDNSYLVNGVIVHNCRSSIVSILKYSKDFPKGTQSSDMGYLPKEYSFNDYLKLQSIEKQNDILGIGRADLWRSGKITLSDLVNQQGKTLSIKELLALDNAGVKVSSVKFDPTKGIIIGKGNTGNVYKYEDKVYKKYSEIEAKAYESLKSIDGVIDAKVKGDFIETDFYKFVITPESIEKMSSGAKAQIVSLVQDSRETINRTINEMSNRGISYSDKLQFVYDTKDKKVKLFDFSNAIIDETKKEDFRNNNLNHLSGFYRGLGLDDLADRVTNARIIRSAGLNDTSWLVYEMPKQVLSNSYPEIISKKIIDTLGETEKKSVYFQRDARDINYGKKFAIIEDAKKGKYVIFNDSLTDDEILKYELEVMIFD